LAGESKAHLQLKNNYFNFAEAETKREEESRGASNREYEEDA